MMDISLIPEQINEPIEHIAGLYSTAFQRIGALRLLLKITELPRQDRWETLARAALRDDVYSAVADMTISVLRTTSSRGSGRADSTERIMQWERGHQEQLARIKDTFAEVTQPGSVDIHSISAALKLLRNLVRHRIRRTRGRGAKRGWHYDRHRQEDEVRELWLGNARLTPVASCSRLGWAREGLSPSETTSSQQHAGVDAKMSP